MAAPSAAESAPAASQAHAGSDNDDPLKRKYFVTRTVIGHGADGGVVRGIHNESEEWHALKYLSRGGYGPEREIEALKKVAGHPNIVSLQGVFAPFGRRPQWVLAMLEADFTLHAFLQRSRGRLRMSEVVCRSLAGQLLSGIAHIHANGMMHRDLKPSNIMLSVSSCVASEAGPAASQAGLVLAIGDFSRSRQVPPTKSTRMRGKTVDSIEVVELEKVMMLTTMVCTLNYCAPEALSAATHDANISALVVQDKDQGKALYGKSVDIWSFGAILFEILTLDLFAPGRGIWDVLLSLVARIGPWPARYGDVEAGTQASAQRLGLKRLQAFGFGVSWKQMLDASIVWEPRFRQTATQLNMLLSPLHRGDCKESEISPTPHSGGEVVGDKRIRRAVPVLEEPVVDHEVGAEKQAICACSGHCYQPGHRYQQGCKSASLVVGFAHCRDCICEVVGCGKPRLRGPLCSRHKSFLESLPVEFRLTWASRRCAPDLVPCGVATFLSHCAQYRNDLATLLVLALLSDSTTMRFWAGTTKAPGHLSGSSCIAGISAKERATTLVKSLIEVVQATARASEQGDFHFEEGLGNIHQTSIQVFSNTDIRDLVNVSIPRKRPGGHRQVLRPVAEDNRGIRRGHEKELSRRLLAASREQTFSS